MAGAADKSPNAYEFQGIGPNLLSRNLKVDAVDDNLRRVSAKPGSSETNDVAE